MSMTREQILSEALALDPRDREELMDDLRQISAGGELSSAQRTELRRRVDELRRGDITPLDGEQVMRELLAELRRK